MDVDGIGYGYEDSSADYFTTQLACEELNDKTATFFREHILLIKNSRDPKDQKPRNFSGSVGGSAKGKTDLDGTYKAEAEGHVHVKDDNGNKVSAKAYGTVTASDGKPSKEAGIEVKYEKEF